MKASKIYMAAVAISSALPLVAVDAVHFSSTENELWQESRVEASSIGTGLSLFVTDGKTAREGSFPWRAWGTTFNELDLDALSLLKSEEREEIMQRLFSPDGDLRFTRGRLTMNANDYSRAWYSCSETEGDFDLKDFNIEHDKTNQIALVKMAQKYQPNLVFWVSPWSPPAWMKLNKDYPVVSSKFNNQPKEKDALLYDGDTDAIDPNEMWLQGDRRRPFPRRLATQNYFIQEPRYLQAYADMFVKFIELYKAEGVPIDRVAYQNEAYSYTPYPGCPWTAEGTVRFNRDYLAPTLKAKAPGVKLYLGTFNTNRKSYIEQILDSPGLLDVIDGICYQWEGRDVMESFDKEGRYKNLHRICSESECGNGQMDWRAAEHTTWLIFQNLGHGADEWYNWNFILCDQGRSPWGWKQNALIRVDSKTKEYTYRPEYYAVKHFSRYIQPGAVQLAFFPWRDKIEAIAYRNPDGSVVVVASNVNGEAKDVNFTIGGSVYNVSLKPHSFNTFLLSEVTLSNPAYLMVYHKDCDHSLHMAVSDDSYNWRAVREGDKAVVDGKDIAEQKGIRDPHILFVPDKRQDAASPCGTYLVAATDLHLFGLREGLRNQEWERAGSKYGWGNNRGIVLLKSKDLINWEKFNLDFTKLGGEWTEVGCVWAPEMVWDDEANKVFLHFTCRFGTDATRIYAVYLNEEMTGLDGMPHPFLIPPVGWDGRGLFGVLDSDIVKDDNGKYHLFYCSHEGCAIIKHAVADKLTGPYRIESKFWDGEKSGHEAPNVWRRPNGMWVLMWDRYSKRPHNFGFIESKDMNDWKWLGYFDSGDMKRTGFFEQKHGGVTAAPKADIEKLEAFWKGK